MSGVRSSCDASATKRRWASSALASRTYAASSCSSMRLKLWLKTPISSARGLWGRRRFRSWVLAIDSAVCATVFSGLSARPVISQLASSAASRVGIEETIRKPSKPLRLVDWILIGWPAITKPCSPRSSRVQRVAYSRSAGPPGTSTVARAVPWAAVPASRPLGMAGAVSPIRPVLERTDPDAVSTSMKGSVRCRRSSAPLSEALIEPLSSLGATLAMTPTASVARCLSPSSWVVP